jgi:hypothetical protein
VNTALVVCQLSKVSVPSAPGPRSSAPDSEPPASTTKLVAPEPPVRLATPLNFIAAGPLTVPAFAPVRSKVVVEAPETVNVLTPAPPTKAIGGAATLKDAVSTVRRTSPATAALASTCGEATVRSTISILSTAAPDDGASGCATSWMITSCATG